MKTAKIVFKKMDDKAKIPSATRDGDIGGIVDSNYL